MTLLLLFWLTLTFTVTTQNETFAKVTDLIEAIRRIADDKDVTTILPMESINETITIPNGTGYFEDSKYLKGQDIQFRRNKNILRWLPKKTRKQDFKKMHEEQDRQKRIEIGETEHRRRIDYVVSIIKDKKFATSYMYREIRRIQKQKQVIDDVRKIVLTIEGQNPATRKIVQKSLLECYHFAKTKYLKSKYRIWIKPNQ